MHRVRRVEPSIWAVRFFRRSQAEAEPDWPMLPRYELVGVVLPLLQPPVVLRPLEDGHVDREVVGVCCLELCDLDTPQRFWPISVRVLELELVARPQESLETD